MTKKQRIKKVLFYFVLWIVGMILALMLLSLETHAFTPPPSSYILSTSIVDVGLDEEIISFTKDNGDYGLNGLPLHSFYNYVSGDLEGGVPYIIWAVVQDTGHPFKLYVSDVEIVFSSDIYFVRYNHNAYVENAYLSFHSIDNTVLGSFVYDDVNSTWQLKRIKPVDDVLEQLTDAYNNGYAEGFQEGKVDPQALLDAFNEGYTEGFEDADNGGFWSWLPVVIGSVLGFILTIFTYEIPLVGLSALSVFLFLSFITVLLLIIKAIRG